MMLMRSAACVSVTALLQLAVALSPCYYPSGERSADVPCETSAAVSVCCTSVDACLPDGLCRLDDAAQDSIGVTYARGTCTDLSWTSDVCFRQYLLFQDGHGSRTSSFIARRAPETTAAAAATASPLSSSGTGGGLSTGAKAGIGIGVAMGIVALGAAGYFQRQARLKRRATGTESAGDDEKRVGASETGGEHGYEMGEAGKGLGGQTAPVICEGGTCSKMRMVGA